MPKQNNKTKADHTGDIPGHTHTQTFNIIFAVIGVSYILCSALNLIESESYAMLLAVWKAVPIWLCAVLSLLANQSMIGVALIFGSTGDMMLEFRNYELFRDDEASRAMIFNMGAGLFAIQHILLIIQFGMWFKYPRPYSYFVYALAISFLWFIRPFCETSSMFYTTVFYGLILTTSCFMSINAMSHPHSMSFESLFVLATVLFWVSDGILILTELKIFSKFFDIGDENIKALERQLMHPLVMITYYSAQCLFANGAMGVYHFNRRRFKLH